MPYVNNKGADQPTHLHSLISAFVVRCVDNISLVSISCVLLGRKPEDRFSCDVAHFFLKKEAKWLRLSG